MEMEWEGREVLVMGADTFLIELPAAATPEGRRMKPASQVRFEISLNGD